MAPGLARVARCRCEGGRKPYSGRPASAGSSRPTTLIEEFDTIRRSTSLAVCWAPIRMMPRERPRSAMSSSRSLIGELPSRGAYLFSSSIMVNSRPPGPAFSLRAVSAAITTPTTNRWARSGRLFRSITVTCWFAVSIVLAEVSVRSPRRIGLSARTDDRSRRMNALTVPMPVTGPAQSARVASSVTLSAIRSTSSGQVRTVVPSIATAPSRPAGTASRTSRVATWWTTIVYWLRSSSTSAKTYGSNSVRQNSANVHQKAFTPDVRPVTCGRPV